MTVQITDNEEQLVQLFRQGSPLAMERLYAGYASYLTGVCARYVTGDADLADVLQESFIKIYTQLERFSYRGPGSLRAWMARIVVNESLQLLRRQKREGTVVLNTDLPDLPDEDPDTEGLPPEAVMTLLRRLPEGYRTVLNLYVIEGRSHKEIGQLLGIRPDSSASQLHRAKNMLAHLINEYKKGKS